MLSWESLTAKVEQALGDIPVVTLFGTPIGNITPEMAAKVATMTIREEVDAYVASIPRVPTNKYDAMITVGGFALLAGAIGGFGYLMYKLDQSDSYTPSWPSGPRYEPAPEPEKKDKDTSSS